MNYRGSSRKLIGNSISAALAAIEIYNKPRFPYRDEVSVVLLVNAWELLLKAMLSKSKQSLYYPKKRNQPYRSLTLPDAFTRAAESTLWPSDIDRIPVELNLDLLQLYRNYVIHFYNEQSFGVVLYSLLQTSIHNYRDIVLEVFRSDIADEITWQILPLGIHAPIDPVQYLKGSVSGKKVKRSHAVEEFLGVLKTSEESVRENRSDPDRLLTLYSVNLQSVKKIQEADIVVGLDTEGDGTPVIVERKVDPNKSHPYRMKDILDKISPEKGVTQYIFQAVTTVYGLREDPRYCWRDSAVSLVRWSPDVVSYMNRIPQSDIDSAVKLYGQQQRARSKYGKR